MSNASALPRPLAPIDVARLEEGRLAQALRETAAEHAPFAGGVVAYGGPGSWQNLAAGAGLDSRCRSRANG